MKYLVSAIVTVSCETEVEAESKEQALEIAQGRPVAGVQHCDYLGSCWQIDTDGEPRDLTVEES